jgi:DNA-binding transcriptional ArsR family regulator
MESTAAILGLSALAHEGRLALFRLLMKAGPGGMAAGAIARKLRSAANTVSAQLTILSHAGLIRARRDGRSIIYAVDIAGMSALLLFLTEDCCDGRPEICLPLAAPCCPPKRKQRA